MPRPKLRTDALREQILSAAFSLLEDGGPASFTTRRLAQLAETSPPAIYELFGDKGGLLREVFVGGFRALHAALSDIDETDDTRADLEHTLLVFREFALSQQALVDLMFSRPFIDFDPGPDDLEAGNAVRTLFVRRVARHLAAGAQDEREWSATDAAHGLLAVAIGLSTQERAGWLGSSPASRTRRWRLAARAFVDGLDGA